MTRDHMMLIAGLFIGIAFGFLINTITTFTIIDQAIRDIDTAAARAEAGLLSEGFPSYAVSIMLVWLRLENVLPILNVMPMIYATFGVLAIILLVAGVAMFWYGKKRSEHP
jgi:hypothetical protein